MSVGATVGEGDKLGERIGPFGPTEKGSVSLLLMYVVDAS